MKSILHRRVRQHGEEWVEEGSRYEGARARRVLTVFSSTGARVSAWVARRESFLRSEVTLLAGRALAQPRAAAPQLRVAAPQPRVDVPQPRVAVPQPRVITHCYPLRNATLIAPEALAMLTAHEADDIHNYVMPSPITHDYLVNSVEHPVDGHMMNYKELINDPTTKVDWETSASNEYGRLFRHHPLGGTPPNPLRTP